MKNEVSVFFVAVGACVFIAIIMGVIYSMNRNDNLTRREQACVASGQEWVSHTVHGNQEYECKAKG